MTATLKARPGLQDLVFSVCHACSRRRFPRSLRTMHQAVAATSVARPTFVPSMPRHSQVVSSRRRQTEEPVSTSEAKNDEHFSSGYLNAVYEDLMSEPRLEVESEKPKVAEPESVVVAVEENPIDRVLAEYARRGDTQGFESFISHNLSEPPTEHQRDLHVKAHLVKVSLPSSSSNHPLPVTQQFPTSALEVLHQYEASGNYAPMKSYTRVISALFNVQTSPSTDTRLGRAAAQAQAWDLFAHMRYVAHPTPDPHLYALMIRACGLFIQPEPERALDLWMEMYENRVEPTKGAYEAVVRVCCRAGPEWLGEGMRLAREMSERHSITGVGGRGLWCALLEGCKRAGDLEKARWILAEAVRGSGEASMVDAELMTHVFHTYASYKPPFRRATTRFVDGDALCNGESSTDAIAQTVEIPDLVDPPPHADTKMPTDDLVEGDNIRSDSVEGMPSFSRLPPQTPSDVIAETRILFESILRDRIRSSEGAPNISLGGFLVGRFAQVQLTPTLLNAYLSVFYRHASIETSQEVYNAVCSDNNVSRGLMLPTDEYPHINALERCAVARMEDRHIAARWAEDVWRRWQPIEAKGLQDGMGHVGSFARLIERAHSAMRRVLLISGDIDGALALLRTFVSRYPPHALIHPPTSHPRSPLDTSSPITPAPFSSKSRSPTLQLFAKPLILSTQTVLLNPPSSTARPLVRLTSGANPKDDRVPPLIGFSDVDLLHARLVEHGRIKDLGYIKWACMAYANALKKRREAILKAGSPSQGKRAESEVD